MPDWASWTLLGVVAWYLIAHSVVIRLPDSMLYECSMFGESKAGAQFTVWLFSPLMFPLYVCCKSVEWCFKTALKAMFD